MSHADSTWADAAAPAVDSLSHRWTASSLQALLATLPLSPLTPWRIAKPLHPDRNGDADSPPMATPRSLMHTWNADSLTHFFNRFRVGFGLGSPSAPPAPPLITWCEFQEDSLHHPDWGYYSDGRVIFGDSTDEADFTTFPVSMRPAFGAMLADRLHSLWLAAAGDDGSPFIVCELGAGTGVLAHDVLAHMAVRAAVVKVEGFDGDARLLVAVCNALGDGEGHGAVCMFCVRCLYHLAASTAPCPKRGGEGLTGCVGSACKNIGIWMNSVVNMRGWFRGLKSCA